MRATRLAISVAALVAMIAIYFASPRAHADEFPRAPQPSCIDIAIPKATIASHGGKWTELTPAQWEFLRGIYVLNPRTAPGLPFGERAALATMDGDNDALVFFLDGGLACAPMSIPQVLIEMVIAVGNGKISHEGTSE